MTRFNVAVGLLFTFTLATSALGIEARVTPRAGAGAAGNATAPLAPSSPGAGIQQPVTVELTEAECKGLGGTVEDVATIGCMVAGGSKQCVTVDSNGVVRRTCINN